MRATLLLNPRSGTLLGRPELAARIEAALRQAGFALEVVAEDAAPDLPGRIERALGSGAPVLIVGGGDGTLRSVAARLAGTGVALGVLPLGTMNLLARDLGLPLEPEAAALALGQAEIRAIDLAEVNGEPFLCQSVIGLPNRIGQHRERLRGDLRLAARWRLGIAALRLFWRHPPLRLALRLEEGPRLHRVWTRALSVVNNAYEEAPGRLFHRPVLDAGTLTLHVARGFSLGWILRMLLAMAAGQWRRSEALLSWRAATLSIHSRRRHLRVMNDGEALLLATPLQYRIHPGALRVLAPRREAAPDIARPPVPEELPA